MLILSRQQGQVVCIGDDITVCVTSTDGINVKLGIDAPKNVRVDRKEVRAARLTSHETPLGELRDIYFQGVIDCSNDPERCYPNTRWGQSAQKAYALAFTEYHNA